MFKNSKKTVSPRRAIVFAKTTLILFLPLLSSISHGEDWVLVWSDEFNYTGAPDPSKWTYDLGGGGFGNGEIQTYTDELENARVEGGSLLIQAQQKEGTRSPAYTSARLLTRERKSMQYGRVEIRAKLPSETGTWAALWMLSTDALYSNVFWPDNGEIDIVEHVGYEEDPLFLQIKGVSWLENIHSTLHTEKRNFQGAGGIGGKTYNPTASSQFHVYAMEWDADRIAFFMDGEQYHVVNKATDVGISARNPPEIIWPYWPFDQRFHFIMNIAIGGNWGGHFRDSFYPSSPYGPNGVNHDGVWPQTMEVDYIRVYESARTVNSPTIIPGILLPTDMDSESGFLLENSSSSGASITFRGIDAGDYVEYYLNVAETGSYQLNAEVTSASGGQTLKVENISNATELMTNALASTGGANSWAWQNLGEITLNRGINVVRITSNGSNYKLGAMRIEAPVVGSWNGFPLDALGIADTGNWLGPIGTQYDPYYYVPLLNGWVYMYNSAVGNIGPAAQWYFAYSPANLKPRDNDTTPWYYSEEAGKWFYASQTTDGAVSSNPQWILLLN